MNKATPLFKIYKCSEFEDWLARQTPQIRTRVYARIDLVCMGHLGDVKLLQDIFELRWKNGIRVYGFRSGYQTLILLYGGNKNGQDKDIKKSKKIYYEITQDLRTFHE